MALAYAIRRLCSGAGVALSVWEGSGSAREEDGYLKGCNVDERGNRSCLGDLCAENGEAAVLILGRKEARAQQNFSFSPSKEVSGKRERVFFFYHEKGGTCSTGDIV
ncbi:hypothetical protein KP509_03G036900 [Ceratopteris richardii]|uniref:Uncharacterized protein n=1 Tax=Ceratopteris richardii TaxID=49495 RepID=A0A8T2V693_CERRI|nr:hypothetical protein KP509_03G036900 [Ceratopteris richardii]